MATEEILLYIAVAIPAVVLLIYGYAVLREEHRRELKRINDRASYLQEINDEYDLRVAESRRRYEEIKRREREYVLECRDRDKRLQARYERDQAMTLIYIDKAPIESIQPKFRKYHPDYKAQEQTNCKSIW